jgi:DnaJ-class molecular chaperone
MIPGSNPANPTMTCPRCNGDGIDPYSLNPECRKCHGNGWVFADEGINEAEKMTDDTEDNDGAGHA